MSVWGEQHGALSIVLSEHHASPDGYLPSPLILATALAARTSTIPIMVAALLVPLHDPVRLAEDMAVLDIISNGPLFTEKEWANLPNLKGMVRAVTPTGAARAFSLTVPPDLHVTPFGVGSVK